MFWERNHLLPDDYLPSSFHADRREALRKQMPTGSVAVFFANPERNRSNDVDYVYHQDPDFYYLTGYKEPNAALLVFPRIKRMRMETPTTRYCLYRRKTNRQSSGMDID